MSAEVLLLCLSGSLYPLALATIIYYLGGARPMQRSLAFAAGGLAVTAVTGTLIVVLVRSVGLTHKKHPTPSPLFDVVVGAGLVVFSAILLARERRHSAADVDLGKAVDAPADRPTDGSLWRAFIAGEHSEPLLTRMSQLVNRYTKPVLLLAGVAVGIYLIGKGLLAL